VQWRIHGQRDACAYLAKEGRNTMSLKLGSRRFTVLLFSLLVIAIVALGAVPRGSPEQAKAYYQSLAKTLELTDSAKIFDTTLDDVTSYLGYPGLSGQDLQRIPSDVLMDPTKLGKPCPATATPESTPCPTTVSNPDLFRQAFLTIPPRAGDILASRFFAPKITNVNDPSETRGLGWRKLVRLRSRPGSSAARHQIDSAIILFNFFTDPGVKPFGASADSVNTQVILTTTAGSITTASDKDSIYWLDYSPIGKGGKLSLELDASFDARDFQPNLAPGGGKSGVQPYYVPDGCIGCHGGENPNRPLINYLDTDHWFDRLDNDFARVRAEGTPVLFDAGSDDTTTPDFARALDVIRQFNEEAERHASVAAPQSFHRTAAQTWLRIHETSNSHFPAIARAVQSSVSWSAQTPGDTETLALLNRYCFRCHGSIKFNVFDKASVQARLTQIRSRLQPLPEQLRQDPGFQMPADRKMDPADLNRLLELLH
jgi:hypothetical protein